MSLASGTRLGPYEVVSPIGKGGMGEVYRARDTKLDRDVAIKVLPEEFANDDDRLARFEREAKLLASLNHPNIASIYGRESGALVLELVEGPTLAERIAEGPIPVEEALAIAKQIAEALEAGHEAGVIHRDLKPANVKVKDDGTVKVLDYGLAKAFEGESAQTTGDSELSHSPTMSRHATAAGMIMGTAAYMSPEQARGKVVDKRADIWAFGVVLFEMLTGRGLFDGETVSDVIAAVLTRETDWGALPGDLPLSIRHLLARCLERNPRERLRDIGDARYELRADAATAEPFHDSAASRGDVRPRRTALLLAGTGLAAVALTFAVMSFRTPSLPAPDSMVFPIPAPPDTRLEQVAISPDGRSLAFVAESPAGVTELWIRDLDSRVERRVEGTEGARDLFWSPDSRSIGFFTAERLWKLEVESGAIESLTSTGQRGGSWNRQNTIVVGGGLGLRRIEANEGSLETTLALDTPSGENAIRYPSFLPDGIHVLFYSRNPKDRDRAGLWVGELETGARTQLTAAASSSAVYVEPGYLLYRRDRYLVAHPFDAVRLVFTGDPVTVADDIWYDPGVTALTNVSASSTGTVVFRTGGPEMSDLAWFDRQGQSQGTVWEPNSFLTVDLSPDGAQVLTGFPGQGPERKVWLYDLPSATARQMETLGDLRGNALFSGDGARAILGVSADATLKVWLMDLASGATPDLLGPTIDSNPTDWHEELIVYDTYEGQSQSIRLFDLATGEDRLLVDGPGNEGFAVVSPDGRWLAYTSDETGEWEVYVATFPDTARRWRISTAGGYQPRWNPSRGELVYLAPDRRMMSVPVRGESAEFQWDAPQPLFQTAIVDLGPYRGTWTFAVAPDGERFLILTRKPQSASPAVAILNWR